VYGSPLQPYTTMVFTGSGLMGRETHNIHSSDFVVFVGGRSGTLGEFCIAYDEGKLIGILTNSGGISNEFLRIAKVVQKDTGSILLTDDRPEELIDRLWDMHNRNAIPSSLAFNRTAEAHLRRPAVTQETRD
jgi:predicted Rossmann-fold nucleotide-binding protein